MSNKTGRKARFKWVACMKIRWIAILIVLSSIIPALFGPAVRAATLPVENQPAAVIEVITRYESPLPVGLTVDLKYTNYSIDPDYILITGWGANIRQTPDSDALKIGQASYYEKLKAVALVQGEYSDTYKTDLWYEVIQRKAGQEIHGYILAALGEHRHFQFQKMADAYNALKNEVDYTLTAYIANYKNRSGVAPLHQGSAVDAFGVKRYQSAPAYYSETTSADFRYLPDGTLLTILAESETFYRVRSLNFDGELFVPKKYVSLANSIGRLNQVIVIDRKNQNEGVFEYVNGRWQMISFIYATTGQQAKYKEPTPLGYYMAIERVSKFIYLDDVTRLNAGYAPYAIRFGGGAYIHGVPVDFRAGQVVNNRIVGWPPMKEYSSTIGTTPRSHKCVRNYTSHAKFLYDWYSPGQAAVIVIE